MPLRTPVFKTGAIPFLLQDGKYKIYQKTLKELGWSDSNWRNAAVKALCLKTSWRQPNIFPAMPFFALCPHRFVGLNAIPCSRVHCQTDTEWVEHPSSVLETDMLPLTPRAYIFSTIFSNVSINTFSWSWLYTTGRLSSSEVVSSHFPGLSYLFSIVNQAGFPCKVAPITIWFIFLSFLSSYFTYFFSSLISSLICDLVYTTGSPSSDDRTSTLSVSLCWLTISQASLPYSSQPQTFAYFCQIFLSLFFSFLSTFKNVKIIAHPYTHNFPIFKHPAGVEPAPPIWKTGVISVRPRMQKIIFFQIFLYSIFRACYICNAEIRIVGGCLPKF